MTANNLFVIHGRISSDLAVKGTDKKAYVFFNVAVSRYYDGKTFTDFLYCKAFGATAGFIGKQFKKGSAIALSGEVRTSKGPDDKFASMYLHVDSANFTVENGKGTGSYAATGRSQEKVGEDSASAFDEAQDEQETESDVSSDDLPF